MATALKPISQKQAVITISDISDTYWISIKGGRVSREKVKYNDGKKGIIQTLTGFIELESLTLTKSFDPSADKTVIAWIKKQLDSPTAFNVAIQPVKSDITGSVADGAGQILYSNCQLGDHKLPEFDRNSTGLAIIEVEVIFNELPTYG
jgi:hypothetical protein